MFKRVVILILLTFAPQAAELRVGQSSFKWGMKLGKFLNSDVNLKTKTISISETHDSLADTQLYLFYNADIYQSDTLDRVTTMLASPLIYSWPIVGSITNLIDQYTPIPVPSEYKVRGFDLNVGLGYDIYRDEASYLGIGVNTGVSMPFIKMKNFTKTVDMLRKVLNVSDTDIQSYKLGVALQGNYSFNDRFSIYASAEYSYQSGSLENGWLLSSVTIEGISYMIDFGARYTIRGWDREFFITAGYTHKGWKSNSINLDMLDSIFSVKMDQIMSVDFDTDIFYLGVGTSF